MSILCAKAVALKKPWEPEFAAYQRQIVAKQPLWPQALLDRDFNLVSGGTDTHLMLVDLRSKNVTGKEAEGLLDAAGITANKNAIPFDPEKPFVASGVRLGTPAVTTRGMKEPEMVRIAEAIDLVLTHRDSKEKVEQGNKS